MEFKLLERYEKCWYVTNKFGKDTYYVYFWIEGNSVWISLSSGNKRKYQYTFEEKERKSSGGLAALQWALEAVLEFPNFYKGLKFIYVQGADSRRRRIYKARLVKYGFYETKLADHGFVLCKKLV